MKKKFEFQLLFFAYLVSSFLFFLYSYTQVDLSLTLSRVSAWQSIQKAFQYIGYYQRPLSTWFYLGLLAIFFLLYAVTLRIIRKGVLTKRQFWKIIFGISLILTFSYPAFSYDFFNYMFTAKTVLVYHKNPYSVIPLQFTGVEPWLSFMHWTHLPSAYTPIWILLTLPAYALGFGYFLFIMWNIKILIVAFYLGAVWFIGKILNILEPKHALLGMAIFALNPLIIIESVVSSHNDILMMTFALLALYLFLRKRILSSWLFLAISAAIKLMTIFLIPVFFLKWNRTYMLVAMLTGLGLVLLTREVLPWYWVWIMPFVALTPQKRWVTFLAGAVSLGLLLRYAPFLYLGNWDPPAMVWKNIGTVLPVAVTALIIILPKFIKMPK